MVEGSEGRVMDFKDVESAPNPNRIEYTDWLGPKGGSLIDHLVSRVNIKTCRKCGKSFNANNPHHRLCYPCFKAYSAWWSECAMKLKHLQWDAGGIYPDFEADLLRPYFRKLMGD